MGIMKNSAIPIVESDDRLLLSLSKAGQNVLLSHSPEEIYRAVGAQVISLGFQGVVFRLTGDGGHLVIPYLTIQPKLLNKLEKIAGISLSSYRVPVQKDGFLEKVTSQKRSLFVDDLIEPFAETLPGVGSTVAAKILGILKLKQAVYAPLSGADKCEGILLIMGTDLSPHDVPAVTVFASQIASALENVRLLAEVRGSERKFKQVTENVADGIAVTVDNRNYWVNPAFARMFGYEPAEMIGKGPGLVVAPAGLEMLEARARKRARGEEVSPSVEVPAIHKSGREMQIHMTSQPVEFDGKSAIQIVVRDITQRVKRENQLKIFSEFMKASKQGFGIATLDGRIHYVNPALLRMIAEPDIDDVIGKPFLVYYPEEYQEKIANEVLPSVLQKGHWLGETALLSRDGVRKEVLEDYFLILDEKGEPKYIADVLSDISRRVQVERELREALDEGRRSRQLLNSLSKASQKVLRAKSFEQVYRTVGAELKSLGLDSLVMALTQDKQKMEIVHSSYAASVLKPAEKLVGVQASGHQFPIQNSSYKAIIQDEKPVFFDQPISIMREAFPKPVRPLITQAARMLGVEKAIMAPILVNSQVFGLLVVTGKHLNEEDVAPISTFANQAAIALENTLLYGKLESRAQELEKSVHQRTKELFESEERYRVLSESSPEMIFVIDRQDKVQYVNTIAAQQFGANPQNIIGKSRFELFPLQVAEAQSVGLQRVFETGEKMYSESRVEFPGREAWLSTWLAPIYDGEIIQAVMGISRDITERKTIEHSLNEKMEQLERFNRLAVGREQRVIALKQRVNELLAELGRDPEFAMTYLDE